MFIIRNSRRYRATLPGIENTLRFVGRAVPLEKLPPGIWTRLHLMLFGYATSSSIGLTVVMIGRRLHPVFYAGWLPHVVDVQNVLGSPTLCLAKLFCLLLIINSHSENTGRFP